MTRRSLRSRLQRYFNAPICEDILLEAEMLILTFATGIEDSTTFADYHCFVSNQTGNTVLLAVAISGLGSDSVDLQNTAVSLSMFVLGGWLMGQIGNLVGCYRRGWLLVSSIFQTALVFAASVVHSKRSSLGDPATVDLIIISLLAISSSGQVAMVRALQMTEITTANATGVYVDIFIDKNLYELHNRPRNRRLLFLFTLFAGSFAGAYAYLRLGSTITLLISAMGKTVATVALFFNKETVEKEDSSGANISTETLAMV